MTTETLHAGVSIPLKAGSLTSGIVGLNISL